MKALSTTIAHAKRPGAAAILRPVLGLTAMVLAPMLTPVASAQEPSLLVAIASGVPCSESAAADVLLRNVTGAGASSEQAIAVLGQLAGDSKTCAPVQAAASALARQFSEASPGADPIAAAAARQRMEQVLREVDQRASSMRFEVGPPPRNVTRPSGRDS